MQPFFESTCVQIVYLSSQNMKESKTQNKNSWMRDPNYNYDGANSQITLTEEETIDEND